MEESRNCGNCFHAHNWLTNPANVSQRTGECRRFPPSVVAVGGQPGQLQTMGVSPPIAASHFCGEHSVKIDRSADKVCEEIHAGAGQIIASQ